MPETHVDKETLQTKVEHHPFATGCQRASKLEEELRKKDSITPEDVMALDRVTSGNRSNVSAVLC